LFILYRVLLVLGRVAETIMLCYFVGGGGGGGRRAKKQALFVANSHATRNITYSDGI
jgi:hypothetical protein